MEDRYLFKAKRIDNGEWVEGNLITDEHDEKKCFIGYVFGTNDDGAPHDYDVVEVDQSTICQCTGLKDKNGKLIWENDIIKCKFGIAVAVWDKSEWRIKLVKDNIWRKDLHYWVVEDNQRTEVIGNIFDNPELLEE